jgi:hypothetical protein
MTRWPRHFFKGAKQMKEGKKTSEFWLELLSSVLAAIIAFGPMIVGKFDENSWPFIVGSFIVAVAIKLGSMGYAKGRSAVKAASAHAEALKASSLSAPLSKES